MLNWLWHEYSSKIFYKFNLIFTVTFFDTLHTYCSKEKKQSFCLCSWTEGPFETTMLMLGTVHKVRHHFFAFVTPPPPPYWQKSTFQWPLSNKDASNLPILTLGITQSLKIADVVYGRPLFDGAPNSLWAWLADKVRAILCFLAVSKTWTSWGTWEQP